jgi:uncharacterized protein (TIGR00251 family)
MIELAAHERGTIVSVLAQPGARRNAILGERAGALRVAVTAAPEKGKANAAVVAVMAEFLDCRGSQIVLVSGETSRQKRLLVCGQGPDEVRRRLATVLADSGPSAPPE